MIAIDLHRGRTAIKIKSNLLCKPLYHFVLQTAKVPPLRFQNDYWSWWNRLNSPAASKKLYALDEIQHTITARLRGVEHDDSNELRSERSRSRNKLTNSTNGSGHEAEDESDENHETKGGEAHDRSICVF